jgi:6-phosphogluconolactonase
MRTALLSTFLTLLMVTAVPAQTFVYVSKAPEQEIQSYRLDGATGELAPVETVKVPGTPGPLTVNPKKNFFFASIRSTATLESYALDQATGKITLLNSAALGQGENGTFVAVDRTGRWLISASYAAGKTVVHRIGDDGKLVSPAVQTVATTKTAHSVIFDRENRFVFVPHVTPNAVYQFSLDVEKGQLKEVARAPGGAEKAGPRHMKFHPTLDMAYTSDESGSSITAYRWSPEQGLTPVQNLSTLPAGFSGNNTTAEIKVHPNGKFVWVSNRGHESLAGFAIDAQGKLTAMGHTPTEKTCRSFEIDPSGKFLFAAGEGSGKLATYRINAENGQLTPLKVYDLGSKSLTWVFAVPLP